MPFEIATGSQSSGGKTNLTINDSANNLQKSVNELHATINSVLAQVDEIINSDWLIWDLTRREWLGPDKQGHVINRLEAGRYKLNDATALVRAANAPLSVNGEPYLAMIKES